MTLFFQNKESLPPDLFVRWESAVSEYDRVLHAICGESETKLLFFYNDTREKSALFWRLLNGKKPLPMPPPTRYAYPWYTIIEESGPQRVISVNFPAYGKPLDPRLAEIRGVDTEDRLFIEQCDWMVVSGNSAAHEMLDAMHDGHFTLVDQNRLMAAGPEWMVRYREWPAYRLFVQRYRWHTLPKFMESVLRLVDKSSWAGTNTTVISAADGDMELESDGWFLELA